MQSEESLFNYTLIRELREKKGWTPHELAMKAGMSEEALRILEKGGTAPRDFELSALSETLGIPVTAFIEDVGWTESERTQMNRFLASHLLALPLPFLYLGYLFYWKQRSCGKGEIRELLDKLLGLEVLILGLFLPAVLFAPAFLEPLGTGSTTSYLVMHWIIVAFCTLGHFSLIRTAIRQGRVPASLWFAPRL